MRSPSLDARPGRRTGGIGAKHPRKSLAQTCAKRTTTPCEEETRPGYCPETTSVGDVVHLKYVACAVSTAGAVKVRLDQDGRHRMTLAGTRASGVCLKETWRSHGPVEPTTTTTTTTTKLNVCASRIARSAKKKT